MEKELKLRLRRRIVLVLILLLELALLAAVPALAQDFTTTPNLALKLPKACSTNWAIYVNGDLTTLDAAICQFHGGFFTVPFSATPVFDLTKGNIFQLTMTGNVTSSTVNQPGVTSGQFLYLLLCQDAVGSRTFTFPVSFQAPLPTVTSTPSRCSASTWIWSASFNSWINVTGGGGGGGGTPTPPNGALQYDQTGSFGAAAFIYNSTDTSGLFSNGQSVASVISKVDGVVGIQSTDATNFAGFVAQSNVAPPATQAGAIAIVSTTVTAGTSAISYSAGTQIGGTQTSTNGTHGGGCYQFSAGLPACGIGSNAIFGDPIGDTSNGQDAIGFASFPAMNKSAGHNMNSVSAFMVKTPLNYNNGLAVTESSVNLWGLEIQDLQGIGTTMTAGLHIEAQTNASSHAFAIKTETNAGPSVLTDSVSSTYFASLTANPATAGQLRLASGDGIDWRNNANGANVALTKNASDNLIWPNSLSIGSTLLTGGGGGTATLPNNTGTVAELNLAQTWTANQSIANGSAIRFFAPNGTTYTGLTGPASHGTTVTFQLPSADSTGVQCISSNGSGVLAFSNCSAGTGTPGGSNKNLQYNNSASFGGASNLNYTSATGVLDVSQLAN